MFLFFFVFSLLSSLFREPSIYYFNVAFFFFFSECVHMRHDMCLCFCLSSNKISYTHTHTLLFMDSKADTRYIGSHFCLLLSIGRNGVTRKKNKKIYHRFFVPPFRFRPVCRFKLKSFVRCSNSEHVCSVCNKIIIKKKQNGTKRNSRTMTLPKWLPLSCHFHMSFKQI